MKPFYLKFADEAQAIEAMPQFRSAEPIYDTVPTGGTWTEWVYRYTAEGVSAEFCSPRELSDAEAILAASYEYSGGDDACDDIVAVELLRLETAPELQRVQVGERGMWITASLTHALDVVGTITKLDAEGDAVTLDGFHVNLMIEMLEDNLEQYVVTPTTPSRVFAGVQ